MLQKNENNFAVHRQLHCPQFHTCDGKCEICIFSLKHDITLQPMDQGVIKTFKHFNRSTVVQKILGEENIDANGTIKINILQAT